MSYSFLSSSRGYPAESRVASTDSHPVLFSIPLFPVQYAVSICTEQFTLDYVSLFEITDLRPLDTPVFVHRKE